MFVSPVTLMFRLLLKALGFSGEGYAGILGVGFSTLSACGKGFGCGYLYQD